ncbi:MAG: radical SAM protein, partial [Ruminococcaceae bacterium]|nr:radical SAM protein [Oscillospiraceae bacterium]
MIGIALHDIRSMTAGELAALLEQMGQPKYRAKQLYKWLQQGVASYEQMTDLPKSLREKLAAECYISAPRIVERLCSSIDETKKYLIEMHDGDLVEAVLMKYNHGYSVCISTQVGCRMGCVFCATGRSGYSRNLTPSEMLGQITAIRDREQVRISNVVLMGMGEPLDNYDNVLRFLELVSDTEGVCIGQRHISVSTCGLVDRIEQLIELRPQFTLSVSLHAP